MRFLALARFLASARFLALALARFLALAERVDCFDDVVCGLVLRASAALGDTNAIVSSTKQTWSILRCTD